MSEPLENQDALVVQDWSGAGTKDNLRISQVSQALIAQRGEH